MSNKHIRLTNDAAKKLIQMVAKDPSETTGKAIVSALIVDEYAKRQRKGLVPTIPNGVS